MGIIRSSHIRYLQEQQSIPNNVSLEKGIILIVDEQFITPNRIHGNSLLTAHKQVVELIPNSNSSTKVSSGGQNKLHSFTKL